MATLYVHRLLVWSHEGTRLVSPYILPAIAGVFIVHLLVKKRQGMGARSPHSLSIVSHAGLFLNRITSGLSVCDRFGTIHLFSVLVGHGHPRRIIQTNKTCDLQPLARAAAVNLKLLHPDWEYMFFTDADIGRFIDKEFREYRPTFDAFTEPIQRVDFPLPCCRSFQTFFFRD